MASLAGSALGPFAIAGTSTTRLPLKKKKKGSAKAKSGDGEGGKARRKEGGGGEEEDDDPPPEVKPAPKKIGRPRKTLEEKRATRRAIKKVGWFWR